MKKKCKLCGGANYINCGCTKQKEEPSLNWIAITGFPEPKPVEFPLFEINIQGENFNSNLGTNSDAITSLQSSATIASEEIDKLNNYVKELQDKIEILEKKLSSLTTSDISNVSLYSGINLSMVLTDIYYQNMGCK